MNVINKNKNFYKKGFSLVELLTVVAILGIISAIASMSYSGYKKNVHRKTIHNTVDEISNALNTCLGLSGGDTNSCNTWEKLGIECDHPYPPIEGTTEEKTFKGTVPSSTTVGSKLNCRAKLREVSGSKKIYCIHIFYKTNQKEGSPSCIDSDGTIVKGDDSVKGVCSEGNTSGTCVKNNW